MSKNSDILSKLTIINARELLDTKKVSSEDLIAATFERIKALNPKLNAFLTLNEQPAIEKAREFDKNPSKFEGKRLAGIPIAVKDVFCTKGLRTTCASKILDNFIPPYESTATQRILDEGGIIIGKTNLDEFCHGSSTETSAYGPTLNPWDISRLPGGSSGGSAAATAADMCVASLGTETAGSIRQPSSWCGVTGIKPTYGRVSRYGVIAMGSSLDSPGPICKTVEDAALMLEIMAGYDPHDGTSVKSESPKYSSKLNEKTIKGLKIGIPKEFIELELEKDVRKAFEEAIKLLKKLGATITEVHLLDPKFASAVYTLSCRSEVSSNLSRYTGTRYGGTTEAKDTVSEYFSELRDMWFGEEAKRRIMTGTFALSSGYYDAFYKRSEEIRGMIAKDLDEKFKKVDIMIAPTTPSVAMKLGSSKDNPLFGEIADILAESSSLSQLPGISVPCGFSEGLPIGLQFFGPKLSEQTLLDVAYAYQKETDWEEKIAPVD